MYPTLTKAPTQVPQGAANTAQTNESVPMEETLRTTLLEARTALRTAWRHLLLLDDTLVGVGEIRGGDAEEGGCGDCIHKIAANLTDQANALRERIYHIARRTGADV